MNFGNFFLSLEPIPPSDDVYQSTLMHQFFQTPSEEVRLKISGGVDWAFVCDWPSHFERRNAYPFEDDDLYFSLGCADEKVTAIETRNFWEVTFDLSKLPSTLQNISMRQCDQYGQINLRALPRCLEHINLASNNYSGKIHFACLPPKLVTFCVYCNRFGGPIVLVGLPSTMQSLDLRMNRFSFSKIWHGDLPDGLLAVSVHWEPEHKSKLQAISGAKKAPSHIQWRGKPSCC